jgi:hypothetical protein
LLTHSHPQTATHQCHIGDYIFIGIFTASVSPLPFVQGSENVIDPLQEISDYDGTKIKEHYAYCFDDVGMEFTTSSNLASLAMKKISHEFHIPKLSAIKKISSQHYIDYTGNEVMPAEHCYIGGGMFVCAK